MVVTKLNFLFIFISHRTFHSQFQMFGINEFLMLMRLELFQILDSTKKIWKSASHLNKSDIIS